LSRSISIWSSAKRRTVAASCLDQGLDGSRQAREFVTSRASAGKRACGRVDSSHSLNIRPSGILLGRGGSGLHSQLYWPSGVRHSVDGEPSRCTKRRRSGCRGFAVMSGPIRSHQGRPSRSQCANRRPIKPTPDSLVAAQSRRQCSPRRKR
jgi:hypothetical protein